MVNMYSSSMSPMGMGSMGMNNSNSVNVHQNLKAKYGIGYEDFGTVPYPQPYPTSYIKARPEPAVQKSWLGRFFKACFLS